MRGERPYHDRPKGSDRAATYILQARSSVWNGRLIRTPAVFTMTTVVTDGIATMLEIQLRDAKARLSKVVDDANRGEPVIITRHGRRTAVIMSFEAWQRLSQVPSFGRLLMAAPIKDGDLPGRSQVPLRADSL